MERDLVKGTPVLTKRRIGDIPMGTAGTVVSPVRLVLTGELLAYDVDFDPPFGVVNVSPQAIQGYPQEDAV